jgi:hypothetical protein
MEAIFMGRRWAFHTRNVFKDTAVDDSIWAKQKRLIRLLATRAERDVAYKALLDVKDRSKNVDGWDTDGVVNGGVLEDVAGVESPAATHEDCLHRRRHQRCDLLLATRAERDVAYKALLDVKDRSKNVDGWDTGKEISRSMKT